MVASGYGLTIPECCSREVLGLKPEELFFIRGKGPLMAISGRQHREGPPGREIGPARGRGRYLDLDDRITRLERVAERLEKAVRVLVNLYHEERVRAGTSP